MVRPIAVLLALTAALATASPARAADPALWTTTKAESYLENHYTNIVVSKCRGTPGTGVRYRYRTKYSKFLCVAVYTSGTDGLVGVIPSGQYFARVVFFHN